MAKEDDVYNKIKMKLMIQPSTVFYTTILFSLKHEWTDTVPTAATNGKNLLINSAWFLALNTEEQIGLILHEICHVAYNHMGRRGNRHPVIWNIAADHVINLQLHKVGYSLPAGGVMDFKYQDMSSEEVYRDLYDEIMKNNEDINAQSIPGGADIQYPEDGDSDKEGSSNSGQGGDNSNSGEKVSASRAQTEDDTKEIDAHITKIILQAKDQAVSSGQGIGDIPSEVMIELDKKINPKLSWETLLQNFMSKFAKTSYSWKRRNRRFVGRGIVMPVNRGKALTDITVAVDASGSVSDYEFSRFINEIAGIHERLKPEKINIIDFDTKIKNVHVATENTDILKDITFTGRGGTNINPVFKWAIKNKPEVLLIFTDGWFNLPDKNKYPNTSILWLIHNNEQFTAERGRIIHYEIYEE